MLASLCENSQLLVGLYFFLPKYKEKKLYKFLFIGVFFLVFNKKSLVFSRNEEEGENPPDGSVKPRSQDQCQNGSVQAFSVQFLFQLCLKQPAKLAQLHLQQHAEIVQVLLPKPAAPTAI